MPNFAANLSFQYQEFPFLDRFAAAAADGFRGVEFLFPYAFAAESVAAAARRAGVRIVLFNLPPGGERHDGRGLAALAGREREFDAALAKALDYAEISIARACMRWPVASRTAPISRPTWPICARRLPSRASASAH